MKSLKIVVTGPFAAGKTTFIKTISEIAVISTEKPITDKHDREKKSETTVAMDFGRITISDDLSLYLFGTPGQERFSFMWETLSQGMLGFVILVEFNDQSSWEESGRILEYFKRVADVPYVVAVNTMGERVETSQLEEIRRALKVDGNVPFLICNASQKESVKEVLLALMDKVLEAVEKREQKR